MRQDEFREGERRQREREREQEEEVDTSSEEEQEMEKGSREITEIEKRRLKQEFLQVMLLSFLEVRTEREIQMNPVVPHPSSLNMRPMKVLPGLTTFAPCANFPVSDSNSLWVQAFLPCHYRSRPCSSSSFDVGSQTSSNTVLRVKLRKFSTVPGPSSFSSATGSPSHSKIAMSLDRAAARFVEAGDPITRKSS